MIAHSYVRKTCAAAECFGYYFLNVSAYRYGFQRRTTDEHFFGNIQFRLIIYGCQRRTPLKDASVEFAGGRIEEVIRYNYRRKFRTSLERTFAYKLGSAEFKRRYAAVLKSGVFYRKSVGLRQVNDSKRGRTRKRSVAYLLQCRREFKRLKHYAVLEGIVSDLRKRSGVHIYGGELFTTVKSIRIYFGYVFAYRNGSKICTTVKRAVSYTAA